MRQHTNSAPSRITLGGCDIRLSDVRGFATNDQKQQTVLLQNGMKLTVTTSEGESLRTALKKAADHIIKTGRRSL